jgi:DNA-binding beta-propeller fold protein YncE/DNA polymerase III epsilon subunit-like protein
MTDQTSLKITRPLAFFDLETTGVNPARDRIVEISVLKIHPDGSKDEKTVRVNPGMLIPPGATKVHGITDEDVAGLPSFSHYSESLLEFFDGCDIGGFNAIRFDVPLLVAEFTRAGHSFDLAGRSVVDPMVIFHIYEPRNLTAAYQKYCGKTLEDAHTSTADVRAAAEIFQAQVQLYPDLPKGMAELHEVCQRRDPDWIDDKGRLIQSEQGPLIAFGKYNGRALDDLASEDPSYLQWILSNDFSQEVRNIVADALEQVNSDKVETVQSLISTKAAYEFSLKWGMEGYGEKKLNFPDGVAVASDGSVYVSDNDYNRIQKFTSGGVFVREWTGKYDGWFDSAVDLEAPPDGIEEFLDDDELSQQWVLNHPPQYDGWFDSAAELAVPSDGIEEVLDDDEFSHSMKDEEGQYLTPFGVGMASDGIVYVANTDNDRIQKFTSEGIVSEWGTTGTGDGEFNLPSGIAVASDGIVYVVDQGNDRIQKFTSDGVFVSKWGTLGSSDGEFNSPSGIAVASDGSVYVADMDNNRVQEFTSDGVFVTRWGTQGSGDGEFEGPKDVTVAPDGSIYVADTYNHRIQKFSPVLNR